MCAHIRNSFELSVLFLSLYRCLLVSLNRFQFQWCSYKNLPSLASMDNQLPAIKIDAKTEERILESSTLAARAIEPTASSCIDENYCYELNTWLLLLFFFYFARHWTTQVEYASKTSHMPLLARLWTMNEQARNKQTNLLSFRVVFHRFSGCYHTLFTLCVCV